MRHMTIRNLPDEVSAALEQEKKRRGLSLTRTVIELLRQSLGLGAVAHRSNGLAEFAGTWSEEEHAAFEQAVASTEQIDEELWK